MRADELDQVVLDIVANLVKWQEEHDHKDIAIRPEPIDGGWAINITFKEDE